MLLFMGSQRVGLNRATQQQSIRIESRVDPNLPGLQVRWQAEAVLLSLVFSRMY